VYAVKVQWSLLNRMASDHPQGRGFDEARISSLCVQGWWHYEMTFAVIKFTPETHSIMHTPAMCGILQSSKSNIMRPQWLQE